MKHVPSKQDMGFLKLTVRCLAKQMESYSPEGPNYPEPDIGWNDKVNKNWLCLPRLSGGPADPAWQATLGLGADPGQG